MLKLRIAALFLSTVSAFAQISDLATTDDGSVLLFATSMRLQGTQDGPQGKLMRWDGQFSLLHTRALNPGNPFDTYSVYGIVLSGDGRAYGYNSATSCVVCGIPATYVRDGIATAANMGARLSHNGRYALGEFPPEAGVFRVDLTDGTKVLVGSPVQAPAVTDSGQVLVLRDSKLYLGQPGEEGRWVADVPGQMRGVAMSADGSRVVYVTQHDGLLELRDGAGVLAALSDERTVLEASLSADGSRVLVVETILDTSRAYWMDLAVGERHDLGIVRSRGATISGDGRIVWLVSDDGRLTRVTLSTGERESIMEAPPRLGSFTANPVRGSLLRLEGRLPAAEWQLTLSNGATRVPIPVIEATDKYIDLQIPWTLPEELDRSWLGVSTEGATFEQLRSVSISPFAPSFWSDPSVIHVIPQPPGSQVMLIKAVPEPFDRLVSQADPGKPARCCTSICRDLGP